MRYCLAILTIAVFSSATSAQQSPRDQDQGDQRARPLAQSNLDATWYRPANRWQKASELVGKKVKNTQDENLGEIGELAIDPDKGRVIYAVLQFGGFLGMGEKYFALPWSALRSSSDQKHVVLSIDKEQLKAERGFDKNGQWPNFADQRWAEETYRFYGQQPYWETNGKNEVYKPTAWWQKASDLMAKDVHSKSSNEELGDVEDLIIDPDNGRVMYAVVDFGTWAEGNGLYAIPWKALELSQGYTHLTLNMTKDELKRAPHFSESTWPNVADRTWARETHVFYRVPLYWEDSRTRTREKISERGDMNAGDRKTTKTQDE